MFWKILIFVGVWPVLLVVVTVVRIFAVALLCLSEAIKPVPGVIRWSLFKAWGFLTLGHSMSLRFAIRQASGSIVMVALGTIFFLCSLELTLVILAPIFALEGSEATTLMRDAATLDELVTLAVLLLPMTFGVVVADLLGLTKLTPFCRVHSFRPAVVLFAVACFVSSLALAGALSWDWPEIMMDGGNPAIPIWLMIPPEGLVVSLVILLCLGVMFCAASFETFFSLIKALIVVVFGCVLMGSLYAVIGGLVRYVGAPVLGLGIKVWQSLRSVALAGGKVGAVLTLLQEKD